MGPHDYVSICEKQRSFMDVPNKELANMLLKSLLKAFKT